MGFIESLLGEVINLSSGLISDTATSVGNFSGVLGAQGVAVAECGLTYIQPMAAKACGNTKDLMHMKTMRDEGWDGLASEGNARFELLDIIAPASQDTSEAVTNLRLDKLFTR